MMGARCTEDLVHVLLHGNADDWADQAHAGQRLETVALVLDVERALEDADELLQVGLDVGAHRVRNLSQRDERARSLLVLAVLLQHREKRLHADVQVVEHELAIVIEN